MQGLLGENIRVDFLMFLNKQFNSEQFQSDDYKQANDIKFHILDIALRPQNLMLKDYSWTEIHQGSTLFEMQKTW